MATAATAKELLLQNTNKFLQKKIYILFIRPELSAP